MRGAGQGAPRPLTQTEERIIDLMRSAAASGCFLLHRDNIRHEISKQFPGTSNIFGALEDLEQDKIVGRDERGWYHLVGVMFVEAPHA
jgi:hypothetical protein